MRSAVVLAVLGAGCGFQLTGGTATEDANGDGAPGDITHGENGEPAGPPFLRMIDVTDGQVVGAPHLGFPLLISVVQEGWLRTTKNGGRIANANGSDLWFSFDAAGTTPLPHEIERYDPGTGTLVTWVRIAALEPTTVFFLHYGDPLRTTMPTPSMVWTPGYAGVWHAGGPLNDASAQNATAINSGSTLGEGQVFEGRSFDVVDDFIDLGSATGIDDLFAGGGTVETWFFARGWGESSYGRLFDKGHATGWSIGVNRVDAGLLESMYFLHGTTAGVYPRWNTALNTVTPNAWHHLAVVYNKDSLTNDATIYIDGSASPVTQLGEPITPLVSDAQHSLYYGNRASLDRTFDGNLDEARVSKGEKTAGWIGTSFNNQVAPNTFSTIGPEL